MVDDGLDPVAVALLPIGEPVVGVAPPPVGWPVAADVAVLDAVDEGLPVSHVFPALTRSKLAQVMRVLFPK